jgi:signal transduction histidine kinase/CheY-like chemotaxis protein
MLAGAVREQSHRLTLVRTLIEHASGVAADALFERALARLQSVTGMAGRSGKLRRFVKRLNDVIERIRYEERILGDARRLQRLQSVTTRLAESVSIEQIGVTIANHGREALGAAGAVVLHQGDGSDLTLVASSGIANEHVRQGILDASIKTPIDRALALGGMMLLEEAGSSPAYDSGPGGSFETGALAVIPVGAAAVMAFLFSQAKTFSNADREFFAALAAQCHQAFERARLYDRERQARTAAEEAKRRLSFLVETSALLGSSLKYEATLNQVTRLAVPAMADWCAVELWEGDEGSTQVAVYHEDPRRIELAGDLRRRYPGPWRGLRHVRDTGEPLLVREITNAHLRRVASDAEHLAKMIEIGPCSAMMVPIVAGRGPLGAITFLMAESGRRYSDADLHTALRLGERAGVAIENARLYRAEQEARAQARTAERRKDEFLAMLGHELRNPLSPIVTALEIMRLSGTDAFSRERKILDRHVRYLLRLVDDLLDVSRITRGKLQLKRELVDLASVIEDAVEVASPLLEERKHQLDVAIPADAPPILGDQVRLSQVFANLLTNAAKYTDHGGHIRVTGAVNGETIVVRVCDNGRGIDAAMAPRVFELFEQGDVTREQLAGGLGLGLAIVKHLVGVHGGEVSVKSDGPGLGSEFEVRLPCHRDRVRPSAIAPKPSFDGFASANQRVLIVDDNVDAADVLAVALSHIGYETATAQDGPSALDVANRFDPDVALLDIGLPVMDGYELARSLRGSRKSARIRLVAITGYGQEEDRRRAREAGFDAHLVKPIMIEAVVREIASARERD